MGQGFDPRLLAKLSAMTGAATLTIGAMNRRGVSPDVGACPAASVEFPLHTNRTNEPNRLAGAVESAVGQLARSQLAARMSAAGLGTAMRIASPHVVSSTVAARPAVSRDVRSETGQTATTNEPNSASSLRLAVRAGSDEGLSEAQLAAVRLLLDGGKVSHVAAALRITTRTLLRWRRSGPFIAELVRQHERRCAAR